MIKAILRYIPSVIVDLAADIAACALAPLIAACVRREGDRYYTWKVFQWAVTHDTDLAAWWRGSYGKDGWLKTRFTQADYDRSRVLRWATRVMWIWRNPAYQVSHWLGFDATGSEPIQRVKEADGVGRMFIRTNYKGQVGFFYEKRTDRWHIQFGWKLYRRDLDGKRMIAFRIKPDF